MRAVRLARELATDCFDDAEKLTHNEVTRRIAGQLYAAVSSIAANLGEGYSRSSGRDRAKIFEYALGSTRESMMWYRSASRILGPDAVLRDWTNWKRFAAYYLRSYRANAVA